MFAQPGIDSFDECLAWPLPEWTLPVTDVAATSEEDLSYSGEATFGSNWPFTAVSLFAGEEVFEGSPDTRPFLTVSCGIDGLGVQIRSFGVSSAGGSVEVTWQAGDGSTQTETWDEWIQGTDFPVYFVSPVDDTAFYDAIKGADSLTVSVASDPAFSQTWELSDNGFWTTPVQANLDACGGE